MLVALIAACGAAPALQPEIPAAQPELKIPDTQAGPPGEPVMVASKLNENGSPVMVEVPLAANLVVTAMPANDPRSIPRLTLSTEPITLDQALQSMEEQSGVQLRPKSKQLGQTPVQFSSSPLAFWEAEQQLTQIAGLSMLHYPDQPARSFMAEPTEGQARPHGSAGPWGLVTLDRVQRTTHIVPPEWTYHEEVTLQGQYWPDPSVKTAIIYPQCILMDGSWQPMPGTVTQLVDSVGSISVGFTVPTSIVVNHLIPQLKCSLPVTLILRTQTVELDLAKGGNVAMAIDGLVVQFFDLQRDGGEASLKYGMIHQLDQPNDAFARQVELYEALIGRVQVSSGDGKWSPLETHGGRSSKGKFTVMDASAAEVRGDGPVKLRWELPSVIQQATVECSFDKVEVP